jgi:metallo-beta-lactamase family protein
VTLSIAFHGAAGTVTGSKYLVTVGGTKVLVDCGMFQGTRDLRDLNWQPCPFPPSAPDAVLLTHAHVDHTGWLPRLVKEGFRGRIYCTPATAELTRILLLDSAKLQQEDADYANRKGYSKHHPALPLYEERDVERTLARVHPVEFRTPLRISDEVTATFRNAGHILGSASIELQCNPPEGPKTLTFSGDLGRFNAPLHSDPDPLEPCDILVLESTYGDRSHGEEPMDEQLRKALLPAIERRGTILIPSFAVARAQLVAVILRELIGAKRLPEIPIHVDSPMASDVTALYNHYIRSESLDQQIPYTTRASLFPNNVRFHRTVAESKQLNNLPGPRIIIASSGMLAGGRVVHHLQRLGPDPKNLIALVGYQAVGTRGRDLVEGRRDLRMYGGTVHIAAEVVNLHGFSAHADHDELIRWVAAQPQKPRAVYLTHGDPEPRELLRADLLSKVGAVSVLPQMHEEHDLAWLYKSEPPA